MPGAIEDLADKGGELIEDAMDEGCAALNELMSQVSSAYIWVGNRIVYLQQAYPGNPVVAIYISEQLIPLRNKLGDMMDGIDNAKDLLGC